MTYRDLLKFMFVCLFILITRTMKVGRMVNVLSQGLYDLRKLGEHHLMGHWKGVKLWERGVMRKNRK